MKSENKTMFLPVLSESDEDRENSDSINRKIDDLEETLKRKIRADSGGHVYEVFGWYSQTTHHMVSVVEK